MGGRRVRQACPVSKAFSLPNCYLRLFAKTMKALKYTVYFNVPNEVFMGHLGCFPSSKPTVATESS